MNRLANNSITLPGMLMAVIFTQTAGAGIIVDHVNGKCTMAQAEKVSHLSTDSTVDDHHLVACSANSTASLRTEDGTTIKLSPNSAINLISYHNDNETENALASIMLVNGSLSVSNSLATGYDIFYKFVTSVGSIDYYGDTLLLRLCNGDCNEIYPLPENAVYLYTDSEDTVFRNYGGGITIDKNHYLSVQSANVKPKNNKDSKAVIKQTFN